MEYLKKDLGSYNLHLIKTKKFKTITVRVNFRSPIIKDEITTRNVLCDMFIQSSKNFKSKRDLTIKTQDLYSIDISTSTNRFGNYTNMNFYLNSLNDKYTEEGNFNKAFDFFTEIIFDPDIKNNKFNKEKLEIVRESNRKMLLSLKEDASNYSVIRMYENLDNTPSSYRGVGYLEDLDKITPESLFKYYQKMLEKDLVDIFVIGDFDFQEMIELIKKKIKLKTLKKKRIPYIVKEQTVRKKKQVVKEKINTTQSKLSIACRTNKLSQHERNYALTLFTIIFGGGVDSKLFKEVREKNSLCYSISAVPNKFDNIILIRAGIDKENYNKTISLVEKILNNMKKGKFTEDDINVAKEYYNTSLDEIEESQGRIIESYFMKDILNTDTIENKRKYINKVTKEEIIKVAKKVKIDTVFLLEGDSNERN